jgi:hypothetical protein
LSLIPGQQGGGDSSGIRLSPTSQENRQHDWLIDMRHAHLFGDEGREA